MSVGFLYAFDSTEYQVDKGVVKNLEHAVWVYLFLFLGILIITLLLIGLIGFFALRRAKREDMEMSAIANGEPLPQSKRKLSKEAARVERERERIRETSPMYQAILKLNGEYTGLSSPYSPLFEEALPFPDYQSWYAFTPMEFVRNNKDKIRSRIKEREIKVTEHYHYGRELEALESKFASLPTEEKEYCLSFKLPSPDLSPVCFKVIALCEVGRKENKIFTLYEGSLRKMISKIENETRKETEIEI